MTQRPDNPRLHDWLDETVGPTPDAVEGTQQVMSQIEETSQVGRWLPFPLLHRKSKARTPTTTDTIEYQPSPIPATKGHSPTVIGRTSSMLSPAKAITAGALVFAIGGVLLIAQPFQQQGGVPGATTDTEPAQTVEVNGQVTFSNTGSIEMWETSDPRLTGAGTWDPTDGYPSDAFPTYFVNGRFLQTDEGTWRQLPVPTVNIPALPKPEWEEDPMWDMVLIGEDGYEGLVFIAQAAWQDGGYGLDVHGYIYDAASPQPIVSDASE